MPLASSDVRQASTVSILWGILLVIFGVLAIGMPLVAAIALTGLIAWLIVLAGVVHLILGFRAHGAGNLIWKVLVGIAYIVFGVYLLTHPVSGVASLTLLLASLFLVEGILDIILYFSMRAMRGSAFVLLDGIVTLILGLLIYVHWPSSSVWAIGTLVGVSMIMSGLTRIMLSMAVRKAATAVA
jgi:uncharacterized membrane protein HdeD (DUF308 family)